MMVSIHGPASTSATKTPISLGMKERVCSLIEVAAWKMLTTRPMISATSSSGADTIRVTSMAVRAIAMTLSGVMVRSSGSVEALGQGAQQQLPAVDQHEQHQLERQRGRGRRHHHHPH